LGVRPQHAGATPVAQASGSEAGGLLDGQLGLLFAVWRGSGLPIAAVSVGWSLPTSVAFCCRLEDLGGSSGGPTANLETDLSRLLARSCETDFQLVLAKWISAAIAKDCSGVTSRRIVIVKFVPPQNFLTYLHLSLDWLGVRFHLACHLLKPMIF